ncbi:MAG: hypothetical protein ACFNVT_06480 [Corynebacterium matruchotii]|jgi:hypothetical protein|uniref:hypothetical protein n=1 Tax=Corynebacterium matruchotii TaxID=43768 RepID=UPI0028897930|nr:hypothetical protein [Corynebacterium matruchotii]
MRRIKLAIVATCAAVTAATITTPAYAAEERSSLETLSVAIEKDGLVKTIESGLDSLSLVPLGLFLLLSSEPGMI